MAEAVLDFTAIMAALKEELEQVTKEDGSPAFTVVEASEPYAGPAHPGPHCFFWYLGRTDSLQGGQTLGNVMYAVNFQITVIWSLQDIAAHPAWQAEIATIDTSIRRRLRANSTLNSSVNDLAITDSDIGYIRFGINPRGAITHRAIEMQVSLHNLEGEAISATPS